MNLIAFSSSHALSLCFYVPFVLDTELPSGEIGRHRFFAMRSWNSKSCVAFAVNPANAACACRFSTVGHRLRIEMHPYLEVTLTFPVFFIVHRVASRERGTHANVVLMISLRCKLVNLQGHSLQWLWSSPRPRSVTPFREKWKTAGEYMCKTCVV